MHEDRPLTSPGSDRAPLPQAAGRPVFLAVRSDSFLPASRSELTLPFKTASASTGAGAVLLSSGPFSGRSRGHGRARHSMPSFHSQSSFRTHGRIIESRNHASIKRLRLLQRRDERERTGLFLAEGMRFVAQAAEAEGEIETVVVAPELLTHPFGQKVARRLRRAGVRSLEVTPEVFHSFSLTEEPQGIAAVVRQRWEPLDRVLPSDGLCWTALSTVHSPGNLGTLLRTSDAVGGAGLILLSPDADPYDPATVRATMGALFSQRFVRATAAELRRWKERHRCALVGTSPAAEEDYHTAAYPPAVVLFMGGERRGLSPEELALCDRVVRIPMVGRSDSLNLAVAAGVLLYELFNQRRVPGAEPGRDTEA